VTFEVAPLSASHDRTAFDCGEPALDRYLREIAMQDAKRRVSNCFVAVDDAGAIAGYFTLAASSIPLDELSEATKKRLPRYPLLPACLIGRLAVDRRFRGRGLGGALIIEAAARASRAEPAVLAMIVDAKDEKAAAFYEHHGFSRFASRPKSLYLPLATALKAKG
jgi:ribosomal protein S18 acetylase RimI-like enzyme